MVAPIRPPLALALLARLAALYGEPHRVYHTRVHVAALLAGLQQYRALASDPALIEAAIWFHDAIYDTRRDDNEERSAVLAENELKALGWPIPSVAQVAAMVRATRGHDAPGAAPDTSLFLDLDLAVLGQNPEHYAAYSAAIRAEYAWVDDTRYRAGRTRVLQGLLAREAIYRTPALFEAREAEARRNLTQELATLLA